MGYKRPAKVYKLTFADGEYEGLEVSVKSVPLGQFLSISSLAELADKTGEEALKAVGELFEGFSEALVSWNVEDENDQPIPATLEGIRTLDFEFMMFVVQEWMQAVASVASPLGQGSSSGETSQVVSLPMETLSASQQSSTSQKAS